MAATVQSSRYSHVQVHDRTLIPYPFFVLSFLPGWPAQIACLRLLRYLRTRRRPVLVQAAEGPSLSTRLEFSILATCVVGQQQFEANVFKYFVLSEHPSQAQ